jgi:hypothetical protein
VRALARKIRTTDGCPQILRVQGVVHRRLRVRADWEA